MNVTGLVVEYNPLHNGHLYHLKKAKELTNPDVVVAVMSGNFVQRGEFAIVDKWTRTQAALDAGIDLVLELPFPFVCQSATQFGQGAIDILHLAKCNNVVFGSETANMEELSEIASMNFNINNFKENMKKGYSYPKVYGYMSDCYGPNDILAISYLRALSKYPEMKAHAILRTSDYLDDDIDVELPSALAIRTALKESKDISKATPMKDLDKYPHPSWDEAYGYIRNILLTTPTEQLHEIFLMDEGIENHLVKQAYNCYSYKEFISAAVTRRYTKSRIQRTLCHLLVNNTKTAMRNLPEYDTIRVLGFSDKGKEYLKYLKENEVKIANHYTANIKEYRDIEYKAAVAYSMNMDEKSRKYISRAEISGLNTSKED